MNGDAYGVSRYVGKDFTHETEIEINNKKILVIWGSYAEDLIPENKTVVDTYIIDVTPERMRNKIGDKKLLELCIEKEKNDEY